MLHTRAVLLLAGAGLGIALVAACEPAVTAPQLGPGRAQVTSAAEPMTGVEAAGTMALMPVVGGRIDLAAGAGLPVHCTLDVPAGALSGPTFFQLTHQAADGALTVNVAARTTELVADPPALGDEPILLFLTYAAQEGTQEVTVTFSPPDGSEPVVARASLSAGRATSLAFRRGRSKYSVIIF